MHTRRIGKTGLAVMLAVASAVLVSLASPGRARADLLTNQKELLPPPKDMMDDGPVPDLSAAEKGCLVKLARDAIEYSAQTGKVYVPRKDQIPEALAAKECQVHVSARVVGKQVASVLGDGPNLVENVTAAAAILAGSKDFGADKFATLSNRKECVLELDVLGPGQLLPADKFQQPKDVSMAIMPGVHGLSVRVTTSDKDIKSAYLETLRSNLRSPAPGPAPRPEDKKAVTVTVTVSIRESEAPINGYSGEEVVAQLFKKMGWSIEEAAQHRSKIVFFRYRTCHLLERGGEPGYVELFRCARLVPSEQIDRARLDERIELLGQYLCYRQFESGLFSFSYCPWTGLYDKSDNSGVSQGGAAWAMSRLARLTGKPGYELAALKAIAAAKIRTFGSARDKAAAGYDFEQAGGPAPESLGATAMLLGATADAPARKDSPAGRLLTPLRDKLAAGVISLQQDDGSFRLFFGDRNDERLRNYYPGQALAALIKVYQSTKDNKCLDAVEKSFKVSHDLFQTAPSGPFCGWNLQAWAGAYEATGKKEYLDFVFQMADYLVGCQASDLDHVYPDVVGAFATQGEIPGAASASYLQGVAAAHRLAVKVADANRLMMTKDDDAKRVAKYAKALKLGGRYLDQLMFKDVEAFYCLTPKDVVGGVKMSLNDPRIRLDYCQQALMALMDVRAELFGEGLAKPQ